MSFSLFGAHYNTEPTVDKPTKWDIKEQQRFVISQPHSVILFHRNSFHLKMAGSDRSSTLSPFRIGIPLAAFCLFVCVQSGYATFERVINDLILLELLLTWLIPLI